MAGLGSLVGRTVWRRDERVWLRSTNVTTIYVLEGPSHFLVWGSLGEEEGWVGRVA